MRRRRSIALCSVVGDDCEHIRAALRLARYPYADVRLPSLVFEERYGAQESPLLHLVDEDIYLKHPAAIFRYVCKLAGLYPRRNLENAAVVDEWMAYHDHLTTVLCLSYGSVVYGVVFEESESVARHVETTSYLQRVLYALDEELAERGPWLGGFATPTAADVLWGVSLIGLLSDERSRACVRLPGRVASYAARCDRAMLEADG